VWARACPLPRPKYRSGIPRTGSDHPLDFHLPPTGRTLGEAAMSAEAVDHVYEVLERLTDTKDHEASRVFYKFATAKYGTHWRYADLLTVLWAAATLIRPQAYLEIGVWRGRSAAVVGAASPECAIYGFDAWLEDYYGIDNPGPDFVRSEMAKVGYRGELTLISGETRQTVPKFLEEHPDLYVDLITVDGDKSIAGCASDLASTLPRLKVGGIVILDDLPRVPTLRPVWDRLVRRDTRYATWEFEDSGLGVAAAIRVGE
jgi:predicted O-methyltransferase YrrM